MYIGLFESVTRNRNPSRKASQIEPYELWLGQSIQEEFHLVVGQLFEFHMLIRLN
jgi:hypothetical protein